MTKMMKFAFVFLVLGSVACEQVVDEQPGNLGECSSGDMMDKTEWMARLAQAQASELSGKRVGRGARGVGRLLDDEDMNIGNGVTIIATQNIIQTPITNPDRILNLNGLSPLGGMVTVAIAAQTEVIPSVASLAGPLIGLLEIGNGGVFVQRLEIDLQPGTVPDFTNPTTSTQGVIFATVPAGTLRVYARHDGNLITPDINRSFGFPGAVNGAANFPRSVGPWTGNANGPVPALVAAFACYQPRFSNQRNTRTVWVYNNAITQATVTGPGAGGVAFYFVPPMAKTLQILRNPVAGVGVTVAIGDSFLTPAMETVTIAAGVNSPVINLPNTVTTIGIATTAPVNSLAMVFEVGF